MSFSLCILLAFITLSSCDAWVMPAGGKSTATRHTASTSSHLGMAAGNKHGENACFLPLEQLDQDYYAPRIVQVRKCGWYLLLVFLNSRWFNIVVTHITIV